MSNYIEQPSQSHDKATTLKNVLGQDAAKPFYIWANDDCANKCDSFVEAKAIRLALFNEGGESVHIVDADGVEVVDTEIEAHEALAKAGYFVGARSPEVKPEFPGAFMVNDPQDPDGYAIVGDDIASVILEARDHLIEPVSEREVHGNVANAIEQINVVHDCSARGWPKAAISDEMAGRAYQRAKSPLSVAESTPSFIVTSGEDIVAQVFERPDQGLSDKDRMAEMWSRARLLALAPKMHAVLTLIANQSLNNERSAEQAVEIMRSQAMQVLDQSRGLHVGDLAAVEPASEGNLHGNVRC